MGLRRLEPTPTEKRLILTGGALFFVPVRVYCAHESEGRMSDRDWTNLLPTGLPDYAAVVNPTATIEVVLTPAAAMSCMRALESGQPIMLEHCGGPWLITEIVTSPEGVTTARGSLWPDASGYEMGNT